MSGNGEFDQCPFCNAAWGECMHVKLLSELDSEAARRSGSKPSGSIPSVVNVNSASQDASVPEKDECVSRKPISASR
jgi:hypothetical protein